MHTGVPVITIDGTCASGKGTVAKKLADFLGFHYLNSGAIYRGLAALALDQKIDLSKEKLVAKIAEDVCQAFEANECDFTKPFMNGLALYTEKVGLAASQIAVFPSVRARLLDYQRQFQKNPGLVAEGRDMGTQVFPLARLKIYLTASVDERATRRYEQLIKGGESVTLALVKKEILKRDQQDMRRVHSPLQKAVGAKVLDSSLMTIQAVVEEILFWWGKASV